MNREARWAIAMMVIMGLTPDALGKALPSATNKPLTACAWWSGPTTDVAGSLPIRQDPIW